jgi:AhpD family alkylhydroperoxidase
MRLTAIEKPKSILMKVFYWLSKKQFGKVLAPLKIIYVRSKPILFASLKILSAEKKLSIPKPTVILIRYFTSHLNACPFCSNAMRYQAHKAGIDRNKLKEILRFEESDLFSPKEKAMLRFIKEVTLNKNCSDETFENLSKYFTEKEIVEITWVNATENYFNLMAKPLGLQSDELKVKTAERLQKQVQTSVA